MTKGIGPVPERLGDRYSVGRVLGRGAMSVVHLAHDDLLDRDVAVKLFRATAETPDQLRAQEAEAKLLGSLNHYALTTLFDAGVDSTLPDQPRIYLVMEYIPGDDLRERLRRGPIVPTQLCWLGFDLAEGLQFVHEAGYLHRDIKPANVLVADRDATRRVRGKLADFGIASIIGRPSDGETTTGTPAYLSPEQVEGKPETRASDVYSLGLVLLEAATASTAFPGSVWESAFARLTHDPVIPDSVPRGITDLLRRMTARAPEDRPRPEEVAAAFQQVLVDMLVAERAVDPTLLADNESARLAALQRYNILDTPSDEAFDQVTYLATRLLRVPIALVSIVDVDRVWFKSRQGWDETEIDRNTAFCTTTDSGPEPWAIPDALADPRTADNALVVAGPQVRSYAAAPLLTSDGHQLGALCVFDREPRDFTADDLRDLRVLAGIVMRELELRLASRRAVFTLGAGALRERPGRRY